MHTKFGSHNGSLYQSMRHSENTKIKLITTMKKRKLAIDLLANPTNQPARVKENH